MEWYEYMKMSLDIIPEEIIAQYQLHSLASDGWIFMEIRKGMPGLKQAGRIANDHQRVNPCCLYPLSLEARHQNYFFLLVVNDFGVKYVGK